MSGVHDSALRPRVAPVSTLSRLAEKLPVARRLWLSPTAYHYRRAHRILKLSQAGVFAMRESAVGSIAARASVYTLRDSGLRVALRHGGSDALVLEEIFDHGCYAPPEPVRNMLDRLPRPPHVLDLGGHIGFFGLYVLSLYPRAEITSVEPDPSNYRLLETCVRLNEREEQWKLVPACAGVADGVANFVSCDPSHGDFARSHVSPSPAPGHLERPVRDIFPLLEGVDLLKLDIEGGEWEILQDPRLGREGPPVVVLEYHPYLCPQEDALSCARRLLTEARYELGPHEVSSRGEGILWAWRRSRGDAA